MEPSPQQYAALQRVANIGGRTWKSQLISDWDSPRLNSYPDADTLRQVRDLFGADWLRQRCKIKVR